MSKPGRKRKAGFREPNGRIQRPTVDRLNAMAATDRLREQAVVLDQPHRRGYGDHQWAASALGRFCLRRRLRKELFEAGEKYALVVSRWRGESCIPRGFANATSRSGDPPEDATVIRWRREMVALEKAIMRHGIQALLAVRTLTLEDGDIGMDQDDAAASGLTAAAVELGLLREFEHPFRG